MTRLSRRDFLKAGGAGAAAALGASALGVDAARAAGDDAVQLIDQGAGVTLRNALISVTVTKATAVITSIQLVGSRLGNQDFNLVSGRHGAGYSTFNYSLGTTSFDKGMSGASFRVVSQTPERVEIAMTTNDPALLPFVAETHMALERESPGLHCFMVFRYPSEMPDGLQIGQLRYAVAAGDPSFTYFVVDDRRGIRQRPTIEETQHWITMQDTTYVLPDGRVWSKYQNITNLEGDNHVFLISNGKLGMSIVQTTKEWFAGGPTKQELTCHDYYDGEILLWHPFTSHYGSPGLAPPKGWAKIYGPFYLHVNEGSGADPATNVREMWEDAKRRAARERRRWPYRWVGEPLYALRTRSSVSGTLRLAGDVSAEGAWVVLSQPGTDWQYENLDYVYYVRAGERGRFTLGAVRPGTYTLTAFVDGVLGEYTREDVRVPAGRHLDLGELRWKPPSRGRTLWQIGTPDRSAGEFHVFDGPDGFRRHLAWLEYPYEFPDGVDFKVGRDAIEERWNYFHPTFRTPGTPFQLQWRGTTPDHSLTSWKIRFDSEGYERGVATLDIALASSVFGSLRVTLNGTELATFDPPPGPPGDNASYRLSDRAMERQLPPIGFPARLIQPGENVITLSPTGPPTGGDWMQPMAGVMYDVIRLQVEEHE